MPPPRSTTTTPLIQSRTPLRVSFIGGGTDLPAFYKEHGGGAVVSTALRRYIHISVRRLPASSPFRCLLGSGPAQEAACADHIEDQITREAVRLTGIRTPLEIRAAFDISSGTGLGSSSSYAVGLLHALHVLQGRRVTWRRLAHEACQIEIEILKHPIGLQDQYIASSGGFRRIAFHPDGTVASSPVGCAPGVRRAFEQHLMLFYVGGQRRAGTILGEVQREMSRNKTHLQTLKSMCDDFVRVLVHGTDLRVLGELLDAAWQLKRKLSDSISNTRIDDIYCRARAKGAIGGKLLGAGGAGFLLLFVPPSQQGTVRRELCDHAELAFESDPRGSRILSGGV